MHTSSHKCRDQKRTLGSLYHPPPYFFKIGSFVELGAGLMAYKPQLSVTISCSTGVTGIAWPCPALFVVLCI